MTAWKRYILIGGLLVLVILALGGYHGVGKSNGAELVLDEESESLHMLCQPGCKKLGSKQGLGMGSPSQS